MNESIKNRAPSYGESIYLKQKSFDSPKKGASFFMLSLVHSPLFNYLTKKSLLCLKWLFYLTKPCFVYHLYLILSETDIEWLKSCKLFLIIFIFSLPWIKRWKINQGCGSGLIVCGSRTKNHQIFQKVENTFQF